MSDLCKAATSFPSGLTEVGFTQRLQVIKDETDLDAKLKEIGLLEDEVKEYIKVNNVKASEGVNDIIKFKSELTQVRRKYQLQKMDQFDKGYL